MEELSLTEGENLRYLTKAAEAMGMDIHNAAFGKVFDISIVKDGVECQPEKDIKITMQLSGDEAGEGQDLKVVHFPEDGKRPERLKASNLKEGEVTFKTGSFSVFSFMDFSLVQKQEGANIIDVEGTIYEDLY